MKTPSHRNHAFTLIELLTVIAIIGILAAIIIPTVGTVRQTAREAQNLSNLRQLTTAFNIYAADNKGSFPREVDNFTTSSGAHWRGLAPYVSSTADPASRANGVLRLTYSPTAGILNDTGLGSHYSTNYYITVDASQSATLSGQGKGKLPVRINEIERPSRVILLADGAQVYPGGDAHFSFNNPSNWGTWTTLTNVVAYDAAKDTDTMASFAQLRYRNRGKLHAAHVDGSARSYAKGELTFGNIIPNR